MRQNEIIDTRSCPSVLNEEEQLLYAQTVNGEPAILVCGARRDVNKVLGAGPLSQHLQLRDENFVGGGVGFCFFSSFIDPVTGQEIPVHVKFLETPDETTFKRVLLEAHANRELYQGKHIHEEQQSNIIGESAHPFIVPRLLSLETVGNEGIAPFERQTRNRLMIVTERIQGSDLNLRIPFEGVDTLEKRLEDFLDDLTHEGVQKIKEWSLFEKLKWHHFSYDTATLSNGRRLYTRESEQSPFDFEEGLEIMEMFKYDAALAVARVGVQLTNALAEVHQSGRFHQDIKPDNIILDDRGRLRLIDFGFVQPTEVPNLTPDNQRVGTPLYWSLAYLRSNETTAQTEMWPVACILFELLTGAKIVEDFEKMSELLQQLSRLNSRNLETFMEDFEGRIPEELMEILKKGLAQDESERFSSMEEFSQKLQQFIRNFGGQRGEFLLEQLRWLK